MNRPQLMATKGLSRLGPFSWMYRAMPSLPTPVSKARDEKGEIRSYKLSDRAIYVLHWC